MGSYLGYIMSALIAPAAHDAQVEVQSQNDVHCCTTTTVVIEDSDDESNWYSKR